MDKTSFHFSFIDAKKLFKLPISLLGSWAKRNSILTESSEKENVFQQNSDATKQYKDPPESTGDFRPS